MRQQFSRLHLVHYFSPSALEEPPELSAFSPPTAWGARARIHWHHRQPLLRYQRQHCRLHSIVQRLNLHCFLRVFLYCSARSWSFFCITSTTWLSSTLGSLLPAASVFFVAPVATVDAIVFCWFCWFCCWEGVPASFVSVLLYRVIERSFILPAVYFRPPLQPPFQLTIVFRGIEAFNFENQVFIQLFSYFSFIHKEVKKFEKLPLKIPSYCD